MACGRGRARLGRTQDDVRREMEEDDQRRHELSPNYTIRQSYTPTFIPLAITVLS
jgi:hypothetical protein